MNNELLEIANELKKRTRYKYKWGRKQNDAYDKLTEFIYATKYFEKLVEEVKRRFVSREDLKQLGDYAVNRWYNFHSAQALESIFNQHPIVKQAQAKDKYCDFFIQDIPFDLKTTVFPQRVPFNLAFAKRHPKKLALWLYQHQSSEQRQHFRNRLFIVLDSKRRPAWTLKAELIWLEQIINDYLNNFDASTLMELEFDGHRFKTDIIWGVEA